MAAFPDHLTEEAAPVDHRSYHAADPVIGQPKRVGAAIFEQYSWLDRPAAPSTPDSYVMPHDT